MGVGSEFEYGMFGEVTQTVGTIASDFQYAGYYYHAPSGLNLTTFRAYNPTLGRWINRDPIGGSRNLYGYCFNDSVNLSDRLGLKPDASAASQFPGSISQAECLCNRCAKDVAKCKADAKNILNALSQAWSNNYSSNNWNGPVPPWINNAVNPGGLTCYSWAGIFQSAVSGVGGNSSFGASTEVWGPWGTTGLQSHSFVRIEITDPKPGQDHCWFYADSGYGDPSNAIVHFGGAPVPGDNWLPGF
jgi:RHS repeat-associated protein